MHPAQDVDTSAATAGRARARSTWTRWFYVALAAVLTGMVLRGFWPSYFGPLASGRLPARPLVIHVHAAVFSGWMLLLLVQVVLAATRRTRLHRRLGSVGVAYGALILVVGLAASFAAPVLHVRAGEWPLDQAAAFMLLPLVDMILFAGFFGAAVAYRRRPEIHKRLILAATVTLAFAAVGRMEFASPAVFLFVWLAPLIAAMVFDLTTRGRVHAVHWISAAVLALAFVRVFFMDSEAWLRVGRALVSAFV